MSFLYAIWKCLEVLIPNGDENTIKSEISSIGDGSINLSKISGWQKQCSSTGLKYILVLTN